MVRRGGGAVTVGRVAIRHASEHTTRWAVDERLQPLAVFRRRTVKRCSSAMNSGSVPL